MMQSLAERRLDRARRKRAELGLPDDYQFGPNELDGIGRDTKPSDFQPVTGNSGFYRR